MAGDPYQQDLELWEELAMGKTYTVDEFLDGLERPYRTAQMLYPIPDSRFEVEEIGEELDVPMYDHDAEAVVLPERNVEAAMELLEYWASRSIPRLSHDSSTFKEVDVSRQYGDYTLRVADEV